MSIVTVPASQFVSFSLKDGISTEASDLKQYFDYFPSQFYIQGQRDKKLFLHEQTHRNNEGEVTHVTYFHPGDARVPRVTLWND